MRIQRIDHVGINVIDLPAAKQFFLDLGLELMGEARLEGSWLDQITGLNGVKTELAMFRTADGEANLELVKYHSPTDENGIQPSASNSLGIRHIAFAVDDVDAIVAKLKTTGTEFFSEVHNYEDIYKLLYVRGPEGIILELAERLR